MFKSWLLLSSLVLISGCTSYGVIENKPQAATLPDEFSSSETYSTSSETYSIRGTLKSQRSGDITLYAAFSGGGTRAAALAYGVLQELRDTNISLNGKQRRLLDEVDVISSVSGGSFTSAYYGLHGDGIFEDFEDAFLRRDVESALIRGVLNPLEWFRQSGRTEMAVKHYQKNIFKGATFADISLEDRPFIVINASDLGYGVRFSFVQEYFNLLCSDINTFPIARAVAASSAVPLLFNPVVLENYSDCKSKKPDWMLAAQKRSAGNPELTQVIKGLETYYLKDGRQYAHFVDGGITDNLGLRAITEIIGIAGGAQTMLRKLGKKPPKYLVTIAVNASTDPEPEMDKSNKQPSVEETINAMSDVQLHRYNTATLKLFEDRWNHWAKEVSTPEKPVRPYYVQVSFRDLAQPDHRKFFNRIPTNFSLTDEQVDELIEAGRQLLRNNPDFQNFLADIKRNEPAD
jgi:NTE family protein